MSNRCLIVMPLLLAACDTDQQQPTSEAAPAAAQPTPGAAELPAESYSYSGPGSYWVADFDADAGTFHIDISDNVGEPVDTEIDGTYTVTNGWSILTISSAVGERALEPGEQILGIEIPGFAFLLRPLDDSYNSVVPMLVEGDCPAADEDLNWMIAQGFGDKDPSSTEDDLFGTYRYDFTEHTAEVTARYALEGYTLQSEPAHSLVLAACDGGVMSIETEYSAAEELPPVNLWMVPGGAMIETFQRDNGEDITKQTMLALHAEAITMDALSSQTFIGMHFGAPTSADTELSGADEAAVGDIQEVQLVFDGGGVATASTITDVGTGALAEGGATLAVEALNTPSDGFFTGTISAGAGLEANVACAVATGMGDADQTMLTCVGQSLDEGGGAFTMTLASR